MRHHRALRALSAALLTAAAAASTGPLAAQQPATLPPDSIPLLDLTGFVPAGNGWRVVGDAAADRRRELRMTTAGGTGVLANTARPGDGQDLRTSWEHGDIDLELEFMMPRASNSGIYFQGRYELQLLDSWGVTAPTFGDVGGIYQRWDESRGSGREGFEGYAPRLNAGRAPGLWQTLRVEFRAPRFDEGGRKVANARFARVELNGVVIHENVELGGPTRGAAFPDEAPAGPLVIQGDHGPVALRGIRYKRYGSDPLRLSDLHYRVFEGEFSGLRDVTGQAPTRSGMAREVNASAAGVADRFLLLHEGTMEVPAAGEYLFELRLNWLDAEGGDGTQGGARLTVGGRELLLHPGQGRVVTARAPLTPGSHPFTLALFKNREGRPPSFTLFAEGPGVARQALHGASAPPRGSAAGPIRVEPTDEPYLLRSFLQHGDEKRTHVISVGEPSGIHYSYDAEAASILAAWRGPFLEATQMWEGRGEPQLAAPLGSVVTLSSQPAVAILPTSDEVWPDSMPATAGYRFLGYRLDEARRPVFRFRLGELELEDRVRPADDGVGLTREISVSGSGAASGAAYLRIATGETIVRQRDGAYVVDGRYYVVPASRTRPTLRTVPGGQELVVPLPRSGTVGYNLVW